jgi:hypothetical protein
MGRDKNRMGGSGKIGIGDMMVKDVRGKVSLYPS